MKLVHWPLIGGLLHLVQRGGDWAGPQHAQAPPRCAIRISHAKFHAQNFIQRIEIGSYIKEIIRRKLN